ncbi:hypothetical protein AaE_006507 [Aphanomyces astaci]|uniref:Uncharacterized protein n=1 Tax=Aphanomyces astaci TaxID=112090 RepID=A0A6A5AJA9_APHAT|nr:hypothetical protein AaE_006507 [Aphanomyces astaci]
MWTSSYLSKVSVQTTGARAEEDAAVVLLSHAGPHGAGHGEGGREVVLKHCVPLGPRHLAEGRVLNLGGRVHKNVYSTMRGEDVLHHLATGLFVRTIRHDAVSILHRTTRTPVSPAEEPVDRCRPRHKSRRVHEEIWPIPARDHRPRPSPKLLARQSAASP